MSNDAFEGANTPAREALDANTLRRATRIQDRVKIDLDKGKPFTRLFSPSSLAVDAAMQALNDEGIPTHLEGSSTQPSPFVFLVVDRPTEITL